MPLKPQELWSSLKLVLSALVPSTTKRAYFGVLAAWLRENMDALGSDLVHQYGLDTFVELDADCYPIDTADVTVSDEVGNLIRQTPTRFDTIAMFLRDQLWPLVAFKTSTQCPNCEEDELRALQDTASGGEIILACDFCGWAQRRDGSRSDVVGTARPATSKQLRTAGIIS